jgi:hypothetical protein
MANSWLSNLGLSVYGDCCTCVMWSYGHASSDICWENTILHIVMIIQFNFENNTQIPSVKVCMHFFGGLCILAYACEVSVNTSLAHFIDSIRRVHGDFILGSLPYCCGILWQKNLYSLSHFLALKVSCMLNIMRELRKCVLFSFLPSVFLKKHH